MDDSLNGIYNYLNLSAYIATAGQPLEEELALIANAGYDVVINLALHDADYSLADERSSVLKLGMQYEHIPVIWENPASEDLGRFFDLMEKHKSQKRFIHCAANMRVSVFMALYRNLKQDWSYHDTMNDVHKIWNPNDIWSEFIRKILTHTMP